MYVKPGAKIADVTYGKGVFWRHVDVTAYDLYPSDIGIHPVTAALPTRAGGLI